MSAIQRKLKQQIRANVVAQSSTSTLQVPTGTDLKTYAIPDVSLYQYDETSGYYYDPSTGLYYDPHSQYYYNNESGAYLYWNQAKSTYTTAEDVSAVSKSSEDNHSNSKDVVDVLLDQNLQEDKKDANKREFKPDKVKVAKKIVKDMEKWAKQLNQKKDLNVMQPAALPFKDEDIAKVSRSGGYADVGFSILENKERSKVALGVPNVPIAGPLINKLVSAYGSDSDEQQETPLNYITEKDLIDIEKLTCLLCKRAFQSLEIMNKHLKMSNLHSENLQKHKFANSNSNSSDNSLHLSYRDRAKERRLKYGECDPPINKSRERFEKEIEKHTVALQVQSSTSLASVPIGENNVGNRLLQKMGWSEGQGLGRSNQGRTNIIEAESRAPAAGLGTKSTNFIPGDDYKSYIKRMMKTRYDQ